MEADNRVYAEADYAAISALQHYVFCKRQCALIHIEQLWKENYLTLAGRLLHDKVHTGKPEQRQSKKTVFGIAVSSARLGLSGKTDTIEYREDGSILIIEMKRGRPKSGDMDKVQLCAQALCLEEMLGKEITHGCLFYGKTRRRLNVEFTQTLRERVIQLAGELHQFLDAGVTPLPEPGKQCRTCSLNEYCLPEAIGARKSAAQYIKRMSRNKLYETDT